MEEVTEIYNGGEKEDNGILIYGIVDCIADIKGFPEGGLDGCDYTHVAVLGFEKPCIFSLVGITLDAETYEKMRKVPRAVVNQFVKSFFEAHVKDAEEEKKE